MNRRNIAVVAVALLLGVCCWATDVQAQYVTYYQPYRPTVAYYAPPAVVAPAAYTVASPVVVTAAAPVAAMPAPVIQAPAPVVATPAPVVTYYRAPTVAYAPIPQVVTRYRPILGGSVSRVRYSYAPVVVP